MSGTMSTCWSSDRVPYQHLIHCLLHLPAQNLETTCIRQHWKCPCTRNSTTDADALQTHGDMVLSLHFCFCLALWSISTGLCLDQRLAVLCLASLDMSSRGCSHLPHSRHSKAPRHIIDFSAPFNPKAS